MKSVSHKKASTAPFHLQEMPKVVKNIETEKRMVGTRALREGNRSYYLMSRELQFCKMKRVLEMDGGDGCTII